MPPVRPRGRRPCPWPAQEHSREASSSVVPAVTRPWTAKKRISGPAAGSSASQYGHSTTSREPRASAPRPLRHCGTWADSSPSPPHRGQGGGSWVWVSRIPGLSGSAGCAVMGPPQSGGGECCGTEQALDVCHEAAGRLDEVVT
jgi:hypothetical protein